MCLWIFSSRYPTFIITYDVIKKNAYFEWKQKHAVFKCKWAAAPPPFSRIRLWLYSSYLRCSAKKNICLVLIIVSITLKTCMCLTQASVHQQSWAGPVNVTSLFTDSANALFWETVYDLWGLKKRSRWIFIIIGWFSYSVHTLPTHIYVQTTSAFSIIGESL